MKKLTQGQLKELLIYDPKSGLFRWRVSLNRRIVVGSVAGTINHYGYRCIKITGYLYRASRLAWLYTKGQWPENDIDHVNRNRSDDRFNNLRTATRSENMCNRVADRNKVLSLPKGVFKHGKRFVMKIRVNGKETRLSFPSIEEATAAYARVAKRLHGKFARTY